MSQGQGLHLIWIEDANRIEFLCTTPLALSDAEYENILELLSSRSAGYYYFYCPSNTVVAERLLGAIEPLIKKAVVHTNTKLPICDEIRIFSVTGLDFVQSHRAALELLSHPHTGESLENFDQDPDYLSKENESLVEEELVGIDMLVRYEKERNSDRNDPYDFV